MGCSYQVTTLDPSLDCEQVCADCTFTHSVSGVPVGNGCLYTWTVTRTCTTGLPQTWQGHELVACGTTRTLTFYCDDNEACPRVRITFSPGPCPKEPQGT